MISNQSNRRSMVQRYFPPLVFPAGSDRILTRRVPSDAMSGREDPTVADECSAAVPSLHVPSPVAVGKSGLKSKRKYEGILKEEVSLYG